MLSLARVVRCCRPGGSAAAENVQQPYGFAARPAHSYLGLFGSGRKNFGVPQRSKSNDRADRLGRWSVALPPLPAGGPFSLTVAGTNQIVLDDILMGDVWFASGQSNMEMPLSGFAGSAVVQNSAEEIRNANHPDLRLLLVHHSATPYPQDDFQGDIAWTVCTPETAAKFSAVAYFFGREIASTEHVPIGLIDSTWGGTPAEAWVSLDGLSADASLMPVFASWARMANKEADVAATMRAEKHEDEAPGRRTRRSLSTPGDPIRHPGILPGCSMA